MTTLTWYTGPHGATWHLVDSGIGELVGGGPGGAPLVEVREGGGLDNPAVVGDGGCPDRVGTTVDFLAAAARRGHEPYDRAFPRLATLGSGWSTLPFHLVRSGEGPDGLDRILREPDGRIAVPPPSTSDELTFRRVLGFYGTSYAGLADRGITVRHAGYTDIGTAFARGEVDYLFGATAAPAEVVAGIGRSTRGGVLLPLPADLVAHLASRWAYTPGTIPADHYPGMQAGDLPTVLMRTTYVVHADADTDTVFRVTDAMLTRRAAVAALHPSMARFDPADLCRDTPVPLHEGSRRAYAKHGYLPEGG
ncbi:MAG TPA: TAXI family TRAP transporter solute-binding subunit [Pseudonocardia sp.]|nr:TAXI family TRAP transporter solute-binding subunit [Pseudonocardia sp.]